MIAGMVFGGAMATFWIVQLQIKYPLPPTTGYVSSRRQDGIAGFYLVIPAAAFVGAVCGIACGVVLERMVDFFRSPEAKRKKAEHRKRKRALRHGQTHDEPHPTSFKAERVNSEKPNDNCFRQA